MKTDFEQTLRMEAAVWAGESSAQARPTRSAEVKWMVALAFLMMALAVGGSAWVYIWGLQTLHNLSAQAVDTSYSASVILRLTEHANRWSIFLALVTVAGSTGFLVLTMAGGWLWQRKSTKRTTKMGRELQARIQKLQDQLADARISEEEARKGQTELEKRFGNLSQTHVLLQEELNQRKQAEKSLTQQTQKLERSKDVLELHVQVRAQELEKLQRRNELILTSAGDGICGFDLQGRATFVNPAAARITGWKIEEMIGKMEEEIFFPPKSKAAAAISSLLKNENGECLPEQTFYRKDGTRFPVEYVRTIIREQDKAVGAVVMFKDVTERKIAEDRLAHKAAELARSNGELEQFAFVASHDLQEPLRKIQAFGDRLKTKCEAVQLVDGRDYLERMQNAAARMQTLINDLLAFSRVIRASQPFVPVSLGSIVKEVLIDLELRIERSKAQVHVGELPTIDADPTQMRQLFQNLLGNALKFQPADAVPVITIEARLVTRDVICEDAGLPIPPPTISPDGQFCLMTIKDNGIGFEEQYLEKIFAAFQRLHGRNEYEGTGVGLAVCRRIADRHQGIITARSEPGSGATFIVILPTRQPKVEEPK